MAIGRAAGVDDWVRALSELAPSQWPAFVTMHSGLPGPRANLNLVTAAATCATAPTVAALRADGGEFAMMCAAAAIGHSAYEADSAASAHDLARDERWRVREGVTIGLQLWGDDDGAALAALVQQWADDRDPLVQRAAVAAICEPRLLRTPEAAAQALDACARATRGLLALPTNERRTPDARTLRQALGYCWSVAVAADPERGLPVFCALGDSDADTAWIVRENLRKKRLSALL